MTDAHIHVIVKQFLLVHLHQVLVGVGVVGARVIGLDVHEGSTVHGLHVAIVHQLVLLDYVFGGRVVDAQHLSRLFNSNPLGLDDVDQVLSFVVVDLDIVSLSTKQIVFGLILTFRLFVLIGIFALAILKLTLNSIVTFILHNFSIVLSRFYNCF